MEQEILLKDHVYWSFDYEYAAIEDAVKATASVVSMGGPLHHHKGSIALTEAILIMDGTDDDFNLSVPLSAISDLYHGFDDVSPTLP
ncbi:hypothetical protein MUY27_03390 [Mucilaginibacter sp. RS28]|uniref:Uncharacterized protein n=1 Tax=Mucilaginibacter straminoryzae TaxID=2932774 RepID=A0A9X1X0W6_9SPHI|nr:hypothetical protein [Mucilaginibacter straminoryzae]MCJ8208736.1 hypothetical protein [Mucilaginibacter straminoryzae]